MGWLYAPQDDRGGKSRVDDYGLKHPICKLPEVDETILKHFRSVGPAMSVGMGLFPVTNSELDAYKRNVAPWMSIWECEQVLVMSQQYCQYINIGKKACKPPYEREYDEEDIRNQNEALDKLLAAEEKAFTALKN